MGVNETASSETVVLDPRGRVNVTRDRIADRLDTLEGTTVGLLDNSKANADVLLDEIGRLLVAEYGVATTVSRRKDKSPIPADSLATQLHDRCDAVVNAYGDCGSCTSWCVYDSVDLERRGTPTATVNSDEFVTLGQAEARALGLPGLPLVTVPHPMGGVPEKEVRERARAVVSEVVAVLTRDHETLEAEYENRYLDADEEVDASGLRCPI
ncbi:hypothetical protein C2R22_03335 [Salinigranum rubrum]|uniref:UGSC-like domain-containing protein n=1 Tax=Salinigranum rubrum TaxID=755307 RepID=A0A2I8VID0_9EURY|nr:UGSC family (seleno)protein [Salinigranum rubrum]AUV80809.1 hypothetical protein C2R22_03335 [Salinigranum rubrum]